jgi:hypothetical protein
MAGSGRAAAAGKRRSAAAKSAGRDVAKPAVEQALVSEFANEPEDTRTFTRMFNKEGDQFSRIFSRGWALRSLEIGEITAMDDATFTKFSERLRKLMENADFSAET